MTHSHQPLISIIMPVKNTDLYLEACLDSIISQQYQNWELIAVNDHSTDKSLSILETYENLDQRIKVLTNDGRGIIDALRLAFHHSQGTFITRMDSDDIMHPAKIDLLYQAASEEQDQSLAVGLVEYFNDESLGEGYKKYAAWLNQLTVSADNFSDIYKECPIPSPCWMCSRKVLKLVDAFEPNIYPEDYDLAFRFKAYNLKIKPVKQVIHYWRDYPTRTSRTDEHYSDNRFSYLKVHHFIRQDYHSHEPLILWGAGHKGKAIAKLLLAENIEFNWACNNPKKIGKDIYGLILHDMEYMDQIESGQVIVSISSGHDDEIINAVIASNPNLAFFRFS